MNSHALTSRIPIDRTLWHALRCALGFHPMARWELRSATLTHKEGRKTVQREIMVNVREAICCGLSEVRPL